MLAALEAAIGFGVANSRNHQRPERESMATVATPFLFLNRLAARQLVGILQVPQL
jgi:hypothetical protein